MLQTKIDSPNISCWDQELPNHEKYNNRQEQAVAERCQAQLQIGLSKHLQIINVALL